MTIKAGFSLLPILLFFLTSLLSCGAIYTIEKFYTSFLLMIMAYLSNLMQISLWELDQVHKVIKYLKKGKKLILLPVDFTIHRLIDSKSLQNYCKKIIIWLNLVFLIAKLHQQDSEDLFSIASTADEHQACNPFVSLLLFLKAFFKLFNVFHVSKWFHVNSLVFSRWHLLFLLSISHMPPYCSLSYCPPWQRFTPWKRT